MAGTGFIGRPQRPQRDPNAQGAWTWERFRDTEIDDYPIDITDALASNELANSVQIRDRVGVTATASLTTSPPAVVVNVTRGGNGTLKAEISVYAKPVTLAQCYTVLNDLKSVFNIHIADLTFHTVDNTSNIVSAADATTFATAVTLADEEKADFNLHRTDDSEDAHQIDDDTNIITATSTPTTLVGLVALINDIRAKYVAHLEDIASGFHANAPDTTNRPSANIIRTFPVLFQWLTDSTSRTRDYR